MTYPFLPDISNTTIEHLEHGIRVYRGQLKRVLEVLDNNPNDLEYHAERSRLEDIIEHFIKTLHIVLDRQYNTQPL